jgi:hypothetical protein
MLAEVTAFEDEHRDDLMFERVLPGNTRAFIRRPTLTGIRAASFHNGEYRARPDAGDKSSVARRKADHRANSVTNKSAGAAESSERFG